MLAQLHYLIRTDHARQADREASLTVSDHTTRHDWTAAQPVEEESAEH